MQKPEGADNQHGNALSYLAGVYFGDGCVDHTHNSKGCESVRFRLRVIDEDFIDRTAEMIKAAFDVVASRYVDNSKRMGKQPLYGLQTGKAVALWLEQSSDKRKTIPKVVYESPENTRAFLEGLLDSEGWASVLDQDGRIYLHVGIAMTGDTLHEVKRLLQSVGVTAGKFSTKKYPSGKVIKQLRLNTASFLASGIRFNIARKQAKVDAFVEARKALKNRLRDAKPVKATFNDYNRELLRDPETGRFQAIV